MKKLIFLSVMFLLTGCGGEAAKSKTTIVQTTATELAEETTAVQTTSETTLETTPETTSQQVIYIEPETTEKIYKKLDFWNYFDVVFSGTSGKGQYSINCNSSGFFGESISDSLAKDIIQNIVIVDSDGNALVNGSLCNGQEVYFKIDYGILHKYEYELKDIDLHRMVIGLEISEVDYQNGHKWGEKKTEYKEKSDYHFMWIKADNLELIYSEKGLSGIKLWGFPQYGEDYRALNTDLQSMIGGECKKTKASESNKRVREYIWIKGNVRIKYHVMYDYSDVNGSEVAFGQIYENYILVEPV